MTREAAAEALAKALAAEEWPDLTWDYICAFSLPERFRSRARAALAAIEHGDIPGVTLAHPKERLCGACYDGEHRAHRPSEGCNCVPCTGQRPGVGVLPESETLAEEPSRDYLGRMVREVWVAWAREQEDPKPSWLVGWDDLPEPDREVDRRIGWTLYEVGSSLASRTRPASVDAESELVAVEAALPPCTNETGWDGPCHHCHLVVALKRLRAVLASGVTIAADREPDERLESIRARWASPQTGLYSAATEDADYRDVRYLLDLLADREPDVLRAKVEAVVNDQDHDIDCRHWRGDGACDCLRRRLRALLAHPATDQEADQ